MTNGTLTEFELVKLENFALRHTTLQNQLQHNLAERGAFIRQIEAAHPGYHWTDEHGLQSNEQEEV